MLEDQVWIATWDSADTGSDGQKGWGQGVTQKVISTLKLNPVNSETINTAWNQTMSLIGNLIQQAEEQAGSQLDMQLDEVTLVVEINSKGQVGIVGTCSGEASGKGAITLKFKRFEREENGS
jgi:hypothetical protein